jgi:hypothetical protein
LTRPTLPALLLIYVTVIAAFAVSLVALQGGEPATAN